MTNFGTLLKNLDPDLRKIVRMIERIRRKLIKRKCSKLYLNKCNEKNVQPKHFRIYIYIYMKPSYNCPYMPCQVSLS